MAIIGTRLFGRTDRVPGLFYVATKFWHVCYIPLYPVSTYLIMEVKVLGYRAINIPTSPTSLLLAWIRALGWLLSFSFIVLMILHLPSSDGNNKGTKDSGEMENEAFAFFLACFFASSGFALFLQTHSGLKNASYERATEICSTFIPTRRRGRQGVQFVIDKRFGMDKESKKSCHGIDHMEMAILSSNKVLPSNNNTDDTCDGLSSSASDVRFANVRGDEEEDPCLQEGTDELITQEKGDHPSNSTLPTAIVLEQM
ncbi:unnamed protein product [Cylindrotheca closterium]|uniref:Uncharacterized protein n=1 Tax=Cylindrotheca closterium TaxID=2856 RepID=A0AAD2GAB8_9STRA|nr:unnamed protein product [Cylindrotheca closterium]